MTTDEYAPSDEEMLSAYVTGRMMRDGLMRTEAEQEFRCGLARVRRDAAREALDGLYEDASQEYRIGLQGDDQERMDAAEAVLRATYAWMDNYPEETP